MNALRAWAEYPSQSGHKLLTDNRDLYIAQSAASRDGNVAPFPARSPADTHAHCVPAAGFSVSDDEE